MTKNKLNVCFCSIPDFSNHAKALYLYMKKSYGENMNFLWVIKDKANIEYMENKNINYILFESNEFYEKMKSVDIIFTTHCDLVDYKPKNCLYIELWHGIGMKPIGYMINMDEFDKWWYKKSISKVDYFIVPSNFWTIIFSSIFYIKKDRILELGYPKFDFIKNKNAKKDLSKVLNIDVNQYSKIIFYTPTIKKTNWKDAEVKVNNNNIFNFELYDENKLLSFLEKNNFLLCIKHHPSEEVYKNFEDTKYVKNILDSDLIKNDITITELLNSSDILISDYSSLIIEYHFLNKPVIYLNNDLEEFSKNRGIFFDDYNFWTIGLKSKNINELINNITISLKNNTDNSNDFLEKRRLWYGDLKTGNCDKICNYIFKNGKLNENLKPYIDIESTLKENITELEKKLNNKELEKEKYKNELNNLYNSKSWKFISFFIKLKSKLIHNKLGADK